MISAVVFDVGGVLVKTDDAVLEAVSRSLESHDLPAPSRDVVVNALGQSNFANVRAAVAAVYRGLDLESAVQACFQTFVRLFPSEVMASFSSFPGTSQVLSDLRQRGIRLGVFTAFRRSEVEAVLLAGGIGDEFDTIVTVDEVDRPRPHPVGLLKVLDRLGVTRQNAIYVGDTEVDIEFARNAGVEVVCVRTGAQSDDRLAAAGPDHLVDDLPAMLALLTSNRRLEGG